MSWWRGIVTLTIVRAQAGYTKVMTAKVLREDLVFTVSGTGQIKPKTYVNVSADGLGRITHLYVKEGDHVKRPGLATVENVQRKRMERSKSRHRRRRWRYWRRHRRAKSGRGHVEHAKADLEQKKLDYDRAQ